MVQADKDAQVAQIKEVISFLDNKAARSQALEILLSLTGTVEQRAHFLETEATKRLLRLILDQEASTGEHNLSLQLLTNLCQDKPFVLQAVSLNVARRIFEFLMRNVTKDTGKSESAGSQAVFNEDALSYDVEGKFVQSIQLAFMLISNVTMVEEGQRHVLGLDGDPKLKGAIIENFFGMFHYFADKPEFDFMANVLANVSAHKEGRETLIEEGMLTKIVEMVKTQAKRGQLANAQRLKHLLECTRNCCFEYEKYEKDFQQSDLLDQLFIILINI